MRTRIAFVYGAAFLVLGAGLLAVVNLLSRAGTATEANALAVRAARVEPMRPNDVVTPYFTEPLTVVETRRGTLAAHQLTENVSRAASEQMLMWSSVALLLMALCAVAVGWWTAGRMLRPVHAMTAKARRLSEHNLHERIGASGPDDELKELGDTLDALLGRLQGAFDSQRRFIANASHELRTPLATQRTAIQVGLDLEGPLPPAPAELARTKELLLDNNRRSERLIEGLLVLARSERGLDQREDVDLAAVVREETETTYGKRAAAAGVRLEVSAEPSVVRANRMLLVQLTANLLANAVAYNRPGGLVEVTVAPGALTVRNTGPVVAAADVPGLFEPFRRGEGRDRMGPG
ncbi:MAG TPA: histidine kinase dimerization/phospho-acceptor domain-containing protein, partial [Streptomyces sp.]|nr:histidine kinase dimerization/phospho-acceptor domain-containing protein [Streptomyces sp.]